MPDTHPAATTPSPAVATTPTANLAGRVVLLARVGTVVAIVSTFLASGAFLSDFAYRAGWDLFPGMPLLLPATIDIAGAAAGVLWISPIVNGNARRFACWMTIAAGLTSIVGNGLEHAVAANVLAMHWTIAVGVGAVPVVMLVALVHLQTVLALPATPADEVPDEVPVEVPATVVTTPVTPDEPRRDDPPKVAATTRRSPTKTSPTTSQSAQRDQTEWIVARLADEARRTGNPPAPADIRAWGRGLTEPIVITEPRSRRIRDEIAARLATSEHVDTRQEA